jgi:ATP-dependent phosphofructokinase / diphosphate-dependent phosphofructokinase
MDLRKPVLAIVVGGTPAPGINAVISAVVREGINSNYSVIGIKQGFKLLKEGRSSDITHRFEDKNAIVGLHTLGGSTLQTSRDILKTRRDIENVFFGLQSMRVRYLVTIGGTVTAHAARLVAATAKKVHGVSFSMVHVPKTIYNDLPLPYGAKTFGYDTAREVGTKIVHNLKIDARSTNRWYVVTVTGQKAGHLTLGIGKSAAATVTIIPEEFTGVELTFDILCDLVEATILKRQAAARGYGTVVLCEGLVDIMPLQSVQAAFGRSSAFHDQDDDKRPTSASPDLQDIDEAKNIIKAIENDADRYKELMDVGHQELARRVSLEMRRRFRKRGVHMNPVSRNIGNELRSADPNASDIELATDLGYGAVRFLQTGGNGCMVTLANGTIRAIPLAKLLDPATGTTAVRQVDIRSLSYEVARKYMTRLLRIDFGNTHLMQQIAAAAKMSFKEFEQRYFPVVALTDMSSQAENALQDREKTKNAEKRSKSPNSVIAAPSPTNNNRRVDD